MAMFTVQPSPPRPLSVSSGRCEVWDESRKDWATPQSSSLTEEKEVRSTLLKRVPSGGGEGLGEMLGLLPAMALARG